VSTKNKRTLNTHYPYLLKWGISYAYDYLRSAGIALRAPGGWGRKAPARAATAVTTGADSSKPAIEVITGFCGPTPVDNSKPANEVITGFLPEGTWPAPGAKRMPGASEAYRELIELELSRGRNAMGIWQDLVDGTGLPVDIRVFSDWCASCAEQYRLKRA
jgi:hypothetical protein